MFERFTSAARQLVLVAQEQRAQLQHPWVGTEHLLLALVLDEGPGGDALRRHGLAADQVALTISSLIGDGVRGEDDRLLGSLGIDMEAVRRSTERSFGPGALDRVRCSRLQPSRRRWLQRRSRTATSSSRFNPRCKRVLELSLREALRLKNNYIGPEHVGLGILREGSGLACLVLAECGVSLDNLQTDWEAIALGSKAA